MIEILERHPAVERAKLVGSRRERDVTELSDWDIQVDVVDFDRFVHDLPRLVEELHPLGHGWDRLSYRWNYMVMLDLPVKVDIILDEPYEAQPPWTVTAETLEGLEHHFWDWILWLGSKQLRGEHDLVHRELAKMHVHLLRPLGVADVPEDVWSAIDTFTRARVAAERRLGLEVGRAMEAAVTRALADALPRPSIP